MKKLRFKIFISVLLSVSMLMGNFLPPLAQAQATSSINSIDFTNLDLDTYSVFHELSPEARELFVEWIVTDHEALEFHNTYIDSADPLTYQPSRARNALILNDLNNQLRAIQGLTQPVINALMGVGASLVAAIGSGVATVGLGTIVGLLTAAAFSRVIILNWSTVSSRWAAITNAFVRVFTGRTATGTITNMRSAFSQSNTVSASVNTVRVNHMSLLRNARTDARSVRHMDLAFLNSVRGSRAPISLFYSFLQ